MFKNSSLSSYLIKKMMRNSSSEKITFLGTAERFFQDAAEKTDIPKDVLELIKKPNSILKMNIPLIRDDGSYITIEGYRCHHK
jgi:glutamate dehydrogenase (NAD(P)+)